MSTVTTNFSFNSTQENWNFNAGSGTNLTGSRDTTASSDSTNDTNSGDGTLQTRRTGKNKSDGSPYWEWGNGTLNWQSLGVPSGATVTAVDVDYDWRCTEYTTGASSSHGPSELRDGDGSSVRGTFNSAGSFTATGNWATQGGTPVTGLTDSSTTAIRLRIGAKPNTGNSTSAAVTLRLDWIKVVVTYTVAYTITASGDSFALTGTSATTKKGAKVPADTTSFSETGTTAVVRTGRRFIAATEAFVVSGTGAGTKRGSSLSAETIGFTHTGTAATLTYVQAGYTIAATSGSFSETGSAAGLKAGSVVIAGAGSLGVVGTSAGVIQGRKIACATASYSATGSASFNWERAVNGRKMTFAAGSGKLMKKINDFVYIDL